jgi:hypothetical protein
MYYYGGGPSAIITVLPQRNKTPEELFDDQEERRAGSLWDSIRVSRSGGCVQEYDGSCTFCSCGVRFWSTR